MAERNRELRSIKGYDPYAAVRNLGSILEGMYDHKIGDEEAKIASGLGAEPTSYEEVLGLYMTARFEVSFIRGEDLSKYDKFILKD